MKFVKILTVLLTVVLLAANGVLLATSGELDTEAPELSVPDGVLELSVTATEEDYLQGVTARDNWDGDISDQVLLEHISQFTGEDTVKVTYGVFDRAGNGSTATRTVHFTDYTGPRIQLSKPLRYGLGWTVTLMDRITAWDDLDGEITNKLRITSLNLSNDVEGIYRITVQVTNSLGDTVVQELPVMITDVTGSTPEISLTDYIIYVKQGEKLDLRQYIASVEDPASETDGSVSRVEISSTVDTAQTGTYEVVYSYQGVWETAKTIMTVIVTE